MTRRRVVITDYEFGHPTGEQRIAAECGAELDFHTHLREGPELLRAVRGADVVMSLYSRITDEVLAELPEASTVIRYGMGFDNIDVSAATARGIRVCNVADYGADTVADHTVALALASLRRIPECDSGIRRDRWLHAPAVGSIPSLGDSTIGLVGTGQIGRKVAQRFQAFGSRILAHDPFVDPASAAALGIDIVPLQTVIAEADVLSLHAPLTPETHHVIGETQLAAMKRTSIIVNTARGRLLDTRAAARAVADGRIAGLALDVFENEPLEPEHPLRTSPRTILTPHAAYYSERSLANLTLFAAEEMGRALRGEPLRCQVNRQRHE